MKYATPPLYLLTRFVLPLGLPLAALTATGLEIGPIARHIVFFGFCGAAMGISLDRTQAGRQRAMNKAARNIAVKGLRKTVSTVVQDPDVLSEILSSLDQWEQLND